LFQPWCFLRGCERFDLSDYWHGASFDINPPSLAIVPIADLEVVVDATAVEGFAGGVESSVIIPVDGACLVHPHAKINCSGFGWDLEANASGFIVGPVVEFEAIAVG
jgi:hypothetical protein